MEDALTALLHPYRLPLFSSALLSVLCGSPLAALAVKSFFRPHPANPT
jgi:hypothetical protein